MANDLPYMPLWIEALLGDTDHLDPPVYAAYTRLLFRMWLRGGVLPDDDHLLARLACLEVRRWRAIRAQVIAFFQPTEGGWTQKRLDAELQKSREKRTKNAQAAQQRWSKSGAKAAPRTRSEKPSKSNGQADADAYANAMPHARSNADAMRSQNQREPYDQGIDGSGSPLPPKGAGQSASPRSAPLADGSLHSARPQGGEPAGDLWQQFRPKPDLHDGLDGPSEQDRDYHAMLAGKPSNWESTMTDEQCRITSIHHLRRPAGTFPLIEAFEHSQRVVTRPKGLPMWIRRILTAYADQEPFPAMPAYFRQWAKELGLTTLWAEPQVDLSDTDIADYQPAPPEPKPSEVPAEQLRSLDPEPLGEHFAALLEQREAERSVMERLTPHHPKQQQPPAPPADPKQHASPSLIEQLKRKQVEADAERASRAHIDRSGGT